MEDDNKKNSNIKDGRLFKPDRLFTKDNFVFFLVLAIPIILVTVGFWYVSWGFAWNIEYGEFVCAEVHPERQINVTWIKLTDGELMYGTYNPEVLDLVPGKSYWFGEGLISGNYGKRLIWVADKNPLT